MRTRTGTLVKKRGKFYLVVSERDPVTTRRKRVWLATDATTRREAEARASELFAPFAARDKSDRLAHIAGQVDAARAQAAALEDAAAPGVLICDAFTVYERHPDRPPAGDATVAQYRCQWGKFEKWLAGACSEATHLHRISPDLARRFMESLNAEGVSANTFNKYRSFLHMVFRVLAKPGRVTVNPWADIKPRKLQTAHRRALSVEELRTVCGAAEGEMRVVLALGLYTGARLGDCCTMRWDHLDLPRGEIVYAPRKTASRTDGKRLRVPLHPALARLLAETPTGKRRGYIVPGIARRYLDQGPAAVTQSIQAHFEKCGIETAGESQGKRQRAPVEVGFHSLRHTAVSLLRDGGASMAAAMAITGHTSAALLDMYTHAGRDTVQAAVSSLPTVTGGDAGPEAIRRVVLPPEVVERLRGMKAKTWRSIRDELLAASA